MSLNGVGGGRTEDAWDGPQRERGDEIIMSHGMQRGWSRDMSALLTFHTRHGGWRHGRSAGQGDKYKAVKWRSHTQEKDGEIKMARGK